MAALFEWCFQRIKDYMRERTGTYGHLPHCIRDQRILSLYKLSAGFIIPTRWKCRSIIKLHVFGILSHDRWFFRVSFYLEARRNTYLRALLLDGWGYFQNIELFNSPFVRSNLYKSYPVPPQLYSFTYLPYTTIHLFWYSKRQYFVGETKWYSSIETLWERCIYELSFIIHPRPPSLY